ncbi:dienelactone hydrolase family protein [Nitratireductor alexandrii]|uniref:dienelactone hydrolase family protein n=1 Tax=Nitratireductor alexandrii TaxID=2448161 RepID=UPI000FD8C8A4|nr:dienelactone hydrolase family protein [Nitratireductor alexandrii]
MKPPRGTDIALDAPHGSFGCYLSRPEGEASAGIVLLQEIFGTNLHIRELADQWADAGFVVIVPDLFWRSAPGLQLGYDGADLDRARAMLAAFDLEAAIDDTLACADYLRAHGTRRVFTVGYCLGGKLSVAAATRPGLDGAVGYYGVGIEKLGIAGNVKCPVMLHFGADDPATPAEALAALGRQLPAGAALFRYQGAGHGFNNWRRPSHDAPAAQLAFARSLAFLGGIG